MLQPRVTPSLPIGREGSLFQRIFSSAERHRSVRRRGLRRLPGPVRRRLLHRQGHLRRRRLRGRARRPRARRTRCSATICSRASSRAPAWPPTSRSSRSSRRATTSPPRASIAGRAATGSCCRGSSAAATRAAIAARRIPLIGRWKMLDNLRRSLSAPASVAALAGGLAAAAARRAASGPRFVARDDRAARPASRVRRDRAAARRHHGAQPPARAAPATSWLALSQIALLDRRSSPIRRG